MNDYAILKNEYEVKRIFEGEAEAVAQIMMKANFPTAIAAWVWTGDDDSLLKNQYGYPAQDTMFAPTGQLAQGQMPETAHHTSAGGFGGLQTHHGFQHGGGETMSGTKGALGRQIRGMPDKGADSWQLQAYEDQFGEMQPSAGERAKSALGWLGGKARSGASWLGDKAKAGAGAVAQAGQTAVRNAGGVVGGAWDAANTAVTEGQKEMGNPFKRLGDSVRRIGGKAKNAFTARMDEAQGHDQRVRQDMGPLREGDTLGEATREHFPKTMDATAQATNAKALKRQADLANHTDEGWDSAGNPYPTTREQEVQSLGDNVEWPEEPTQAPMPGATPEQPTPAPMPEATPEQPAASVSGQTAVVNSNAPYYDKRHASGGIPGVAAGTDKRLQEGWEKYRGGVAEDQQYSWPDFISSLGDKTQGRVAQGKTSEGGRTGIAGDLSNEQMGEISQGIGFGEAVRERQKLLESQGGGQTGGAQPSQAPMPEATPEQPAASVSGQNKGVFPSAENNWGMGFDKNASFDAHQAAWDALLKGL